MELGHIDKLFVKNKRKKAPQGKILELFHLDTLTTTFWMEDSTQVKKKSEHLPPPYHALVARLMLHFLNKCEKTMSTVILLITFTKSCFFFAHFFPSGFSFRDKKSRGWEGTIISSSITPKRSWLPHIFNRTVYQAATRWDLSSLLNNFFQS